jgi:hypothetical protein
MSAGEAAEVEVLQVCDHLDEPESAPRPYHPKPPTTILNEPRNNTYRIPHTTTILHRLCDPEHEVSALCRIPIKNRHHPVISHLFN